MRLFFSRNLKKNSMKTILFIACLLWGGVRMMACTTAIVSGKATPDGRPLLFKQRDTGHLSNKLMSFSDGKYAYLGIVNAADTVGLEVWGGYNSAGFAIMNSASYNLNTPLEGKNTEEREGIVMKKALQTCATVADFEKLLMELPRPMRVSANFGVIDAEGGAAYYETGNYDYVKYDANDARIAPYGYLIRTNSSNSGDRKKDMGLSRFQQASTLFYEAALGNRISPPFLLNEVACCLTHGLTGTNLRENLPATADRPVMAPFRDYIIRYSTASTIAVQGVRKGEAADFTMMWTRMGFPLTTVVFPVWLNAKELYPSVVLAGSKGRAPLCEWGLMLKSRLFPIKAGEGTDYIDRAALLAADGKGIMQRLAPLDEMLWQRSNEMLGEWRKHGKMDTTQLQAFNQWVDREVKAYYFQIMRIDPDEFVSD